MGRIRVKLERNTGLGVLTAIDGEGAPLSQLSALSDIAGILLKRVTNRG